MNEEDFEDFKESKNIKKINEKIMISNFDKNKFKNKI